MSMKAEAPKIPTLPVFQCLRCGWSWFPRKQEVSRRCPHCQSPYWDRLRRVKKVKTCQELWGHAAGCVCLKIKKVK
jgi:hypothetical protein